MAAVNFAKPTARQADENQAPQHQLQSVASDSAKQQRQSLGQGVLDARSITTIQKHRGGSTELLDLSELDALSKDARVGLPRSLAAQLGDLGRVHSLHGTDPAPADT